MATKTNPTLNPFSILTPAFKSGSDTPREYLERCIHVIEEHEETIGAFVTTNFNGARKAADHSTQRWKTGTPLSLIDGMPVGVKDIMETADMVTEQGSPLFQNWQMGRDCAAVSALREAGAVILGKTVTTEFAATQPRGTRNPCDLDRTPGGSSSGSAAAVGSGMIPGATASQVIGSTIRPASYCGAYGFKPSVGGINRGGSFDNFSQSCTGVIAANLTDTWLMARTMSEKIGGDPGYPGLLGPSNLPEEKTPQKIVILETAGWKSASDEAKSQMGFVRNKLADSNFELIDRNSHKVVNSVEKEIENANLISRSINAWEGRWPLNTYASDLNPEKLSPSAHERLAQANDLDQAQYEKLLSQRSDARTLYAQLKNEGDLCITLSAPAAAPVGLDWTGDPNFTVPTSLLGVPAITLPVLKDEELPLGLQLIGFVNEDANLFSLARTISKIFNT